MNSARTAIKNYAFGAVTVGAAALVQALIPGAAVAAASQCTVGATCTVGEFIYDDEYVAVTDSTCTITAKYPDGNNFFVEDVTGTADGWYEHVFTAPATVGFYRTQFCCLVDGQTMCLDKSFTVNEQISVSLDTDSIASAVWSYSGRTLTSFGSLINNIWNHNSREVTNLGTVVRDVWSFATRTLTGTGTQTTATVTVDPAISSQLADIRLQLEKLVNKPIVENFLEEDNVDLGQKLEETSKVLSDIYIGNQYVVSQVGLAALKWNSLPVSEVMASVMDFNRALEDETKVAWLKDNWSWPEAGQIYDRTRLARADLVSVQTILATSGKSSVAYSQLKSALKHLEEAEKLIGASRDEAGQRTAYGQFRQVQSLAASWDQKRESLDKILAGWKPGQESDIKPKVEGVYKEILVINRIPGLDKAISVKLKNRILGLMAVVDINKKILASANKSVANTWLEEGSVVFKTLVTNPSTMISQEVPLEYYLPPEVKEEDILEVDSGLKTKYDPDKGQILVTGALLVGPGQSRTVSVRVQDTWVISDTAVDSVRKQAAELSRPLEKTAFFAQGVTLAADINASLDKIVNLQSMAVTPEQKIRSYREATIEMAAVQEKLAKLQELVTQAGSAGGLLGFVGGAQVLAVWGLIIVVVAGFVFLALYMRTISAHPVKIPLVDAADADPHEAVAKTEPVKRKNIWWPVIHMLLFAATSSAVTGFVVWKAMSEKLTSVETDRPEVVQARVLAAEAGETEGEAEAVGGPDIIKIEVPTGFAVHLRSAPGLEGEIISKIPVSTEAIRLEERPGWVSVDVAGQIGWVAADYVREAVKSLQSGEKEIVVSDTPTGWLRVRSAPNGVEIAKVESGRRFPVVEQNGGWVQIVLDDGRRGWISQAYTDKGIVQVVD